MSVILRPPADDPVGRRLDELTETAADLAGPDHWQTGQTGSAHFTVRALERYRDEVPADDPAVERYRTALEVAAAKVGALRFEITGLTLTPATVMAAARPLDDAAGRFADLFASALGEDAWLERDHFTRDIWYVNLVHFTADIDRPEDLVSWVRSHRATPVGTVELPVAELARFRLRLGARPAMWPTVLGVGGFGGGGGGPAARHPGARE
ncbi:hypothetical protein [Kribbella amoyensis]|uniref:hypothetical protein n=1 Tax=Kribbella amoyensis TaxID=996641 RepID=UPI0011A44672|nr:hypothetical protein [Kribbella amoyensis]